MVYVLSDIHGNERRFDSILKQINLQAEDTLYILGDVIDRHPAGIQILTRIMASQNMKMLLGNHEYMMLEALGCPYEADAITDKWSREKAKHLWHYNGGIVTHNSFMALDKPQQTKLLDFLQSLAVCKKTKPACTYFLAKGGKCSFPLSGYDLCNSFQCKYNCKSLRRKESCDNCAYYLLKRCHHKKGDGNKDTTFATFCCFFKGPKDKKYYQIRQELLAEMEKSVIGRWDSVISYPGLRVGDGITHISFGRGEITYLNRAKKEIRVFFPNKGEEKPFVFPDAIEQGYLKL